MPQQHDVSRDFKRWLDSAEVGPYVPVFKDPVFASSLRPALQLFYASKAKEFSVKLAPL